MTSLEKTLLNLMVAKGDVVCQSGCQFFRAWQTVKADIIEDNQISVNFWFCQEMWKLKSASFSCWFFFLHLSLSFLSRDFIKTSQKKSLQTNGMVIVQIKKMLLVIWIGEENRCIFKMTHANSLPEITCQTPFHICSGVKVTILRRYFS